jgi:FkbM family methyltransferase
LLRTLRHAVRTRLARRWDVPEIPFALERLKQNGFSPALVFDVGAYQGDFAALCFQLWPETRVACFEVLPEPSKNILTMAQNGKSLQLISCLLGAENKGEVEFNLADTASSVLPEQAHPAKRKATFPMRTIDDVVEHDLQGRVPEFLKMDVQGYELEVLKGATRSLPSVQVVLAEVNLLDIYEGVPLVGEFISWMRERGWAAYDICGLMRRPLDRALWQADMIFVPENSRFRENKHYA